MRISDLFRSRSISRSQLDHEKLAALVESMRGGWRDDSVVKYEEYAGAKQILAGHRRTLAYVIANTIGADVDPLEFIQAESGGDEAFFITSYDKWVHSHCGYLEVPATQVEFESEKQSQLMIIADNAGRDDDDPVGLACAISRAVIAGATHAEISAMTGINTKRDLRRMLALADAPETIQEMVSNGKLPLSAFGHIVKLSPRAQDVVYDIIKNLEQVKTGEVEEMVDNLLGYKRPQYITGFNPLDTNSNKLLLAAIERVGEDEMLRLVALNGNNAHAHIEIIPPDFSSAGINCSTCPLHGLLAAIPPIMSKPPYPCQTDASYTAGCVWYGEMVYADHRVADKAETPSWFSNFNEAAGHYIQLGAAAPIEVQPNTPPVKLRREKLGRWIAAMTTNTTDHPMACHCDNCQWQTSGSPVHSDPDAPQCQFAARRTELLQGSITNGRLTIPYCNGYSPRTLQLPEPSGDTEVDKYTDILSLIALACKQARQPLLSYLTGVPLDKARPPEWLDNFLTQFQTSGQLLWLLELAMCEYTLFVRGKSVRLNTATGPERVEFSVLQ